MFATSVRSVTQEGRLCVEEKRVIVYRAPGHVTVPGHAGSQAPPRLSDRAGVTAGPHGEVGRNPPTQIDWTEIFLPTAVTLFQFSALTYNSHRIHYDHRYVTREAGHPDLLVHGPLTALVLLDAAQRHRSTPVKRFRYRAVSPLFVDDPITLTGPKVDLGDLAEGGDERVVHALNPSGGVGMRGWVS